MFFKPGQGSSRPLSRWFYKATVGKLGISSLVWLIPLSIVAIPLIIVLALTLFLLLSLLSLLSFIFYLVSLRPLLRSKRDDRTIEVEYWIEPKDKP
jgi:hypothetical protein